MAKAGGARVFFDIVGQLQSQKLLGDTRAAMVVQEAIVIDTLGGIADAFAESTQFILDGVNTVVQAFFEYEQQLVRVRKFYQGTATEARVFADAAMEMGHAFAFTGAESLAAAARTAQLKNVLGSQNAVIEATRQGLMMAQVGEMETELGMNRFIALAQQTGFLLGGLTEAQYKALDAEQQANIVRESSIHALNQLNTIENTSVATMEDITFVLNQFASQADIAGESIGEMAAMSALLLETGEEVSRAGTGLRMIYQRLGNANNEATKAIAELIPGLDAQGVAQMKLTDVIKAISPAYDEMGAAEKRALAVSIAGSRHYIKFLKIMENQGRLTEMQTDAFHALYPAIEEFENKTESSVFKATQMEAKLNDMKVLLGEELAKAYMQSYKAQEFFIRGARTLIELPYADKAVGMLIGISAAYKETVQPISELVLRTAGLAVALKTYTAASPKAISRTRDLAEEFRAMSHANKVSTRMLSLNADATLAHTNRMNIQQQSIMGVAHAEMRKNRARFKGIYEDRAAVKGQQEKILLDIQEAETAGKSAKAIKQLHFEKGKLSRQMTALNKKRSKAHSLFEKSRLNFEHEKEISARISATKAGRLVIDNREIQTMFKNVAAQKALNNALLEYTETMASEIVLMEELDAEMIKQLEIKDLGIQQSMEEERARIAALRAEEAEIMAKGGNTAATREKIQASQQNIMTMGQERAAIQGTIVANKQFTLSQKAAAGGVKGFTAQLKLGAIAFKENGMAAKGATAGLMGMATLLPFIVDDTQQMSAMFYSVGLMALTYAIPALFKMNAALVKTGVAAGFASGGLTVIAGILSGLAVYAGFQIFDDKFGESLQSDISKVDELNDSLDTTAAILKDLQGPSGEGKVLENMFGMTYNDLKKDSDLTLQTLADIQTKRKEIEALRDTAEDAGDDTLYDAYDTQLEQMGVIESKVKSIADAQSVVNNTIKDQNAFLAESLIIEEKALADKQLNRYVDERGRIAYQIGYDTNGDGKIDTLLDDDIIGRFQVSAGQTTDNFASAEARAIERMNEYKLDLQTRYQGDAHDFTVDYYRNLLHVAEDGNEALVEADRVMYDALNQQTEEFANAREELFFGERANFTGAIYKNITQGGVESVLHRVEFIQTNNFNGMVLDEMVEQVSQGVVSELRSMGVPL